MSRIPLPDRASHSHEVREAIGERPANVSLLMAAASGPVYRGLGQLGSALIRGSPLPPKLRELAILRVGYISRSAYEVFQHEALARHIGMDEAQIDAIRAGDGASPALGQAERDVMAFVEDIVVNVRASDATLAAVRQHLDISQLVDLIVVTGYYMTVCRLLETSGIEIEEEPIDWSVFGQSN
jgi:4-carboxymuconolactone decarboxylase